MKKELLQLIRIILSMCSDPKTTESDFKEWCRKKSNRFDGLVWEYYQTLKLQEVYSENLYGLEVLATSIRGIAVDNLAHTDWAGRVGWMKTYAEKCLQN